MKRIFALCLLLMFALPTLAETADAAPFTFRNGAMWGMSLDEVVALEGESEYDYSENSLPYTLHEYAPVKVSRYEATPVYAFVGERLVFTAYYQFDYEDLSADSAYLRGALTSLYGAPVPGDPDEIAALFGPLGGEIVEGINDCHMWTLHDTRIWQFIFEESDIYIIYLDAAFDPAEIGHYDTTGL